VNVLDGALQPLGRAIRSLVTRSEAIGLSSLVLKLMATVRLPAPATALTVPETEGVTLTVSLLPDVPAMPPVAGPWQPLKMRQSKPADEYTKQRKFILPSPAYY
jgi:hypothetical protein